MRKHTLAASRLSRQVLMLPSICQASASSGWRAQICENTAFASSRRLPCISARPCFFIIFIGLLLLPISTHVPNKLVQVGVLSFRFAMLDSRSNLSPMAMKCRAKLPRFQRDLGCGVACGGEVGFLSLVHGNLVYSARSLP